MTSLSEYLERNRIRQADFGARIGVTQGTVSRWCSKRLLPDMVQAARIQKETAGEVTMESWVCDEFKDVFDQQKGAA